MTCNSRDHTQVFAVAHPPDRVVGRRNDGRDRLQQRSFSSQSSWQYLEPHMPPA
jgi:hypothetical protein